MTYLAMLGKCQYEFCDVTIVPKVSMTEINYSDFEKQVDVTRLRA